MKEGALIPPNRRAPRSLVETVGDKLPKFNSISEISNYQTTNPFFQNPTFNCLLSVDYLRFTIPFQLVNYQEIVKFLKSVKVPLYALKNNRGQINYTFNGESYKIYFHLIFDKNLGNFVCCILRISQPTRELIEHIHLLLKSKYLISIVEYSVDMYSDNLSELYTLVKYSMMLRWAVGNPGTYLTTCYANNIRKSRVTGAKCYLKEIDDRICVRVESTLKRKFFKDNSINTVYDLFKLEPYDIFKRLTFRNVKEKTIGNKIKRVSKKEFAKTISGIDLADIASAFYHASIFTELNKSIVLFARDIKSLLGKGVYLEKNNFESLFFQKISDKSFF